MPAGSLPKYTQWLGPKMDIGNANQVSLTWEVGTQSPRPHVPPPSPFPGVRSQSQESSSYTTLRDALLSEFVGSTSVLGLQLYLHPVTGSPGTEGQLPGASGRRLYEVNFHQAELQLSSVFKMGHRLPGPGTPGARSVLMFRSAIGK